VLILPYFLENALEEVLTLNTFAIIEYQINKFIDLFLTEMLEAKQI
jgi:hypothetical protein